jgi:hypothetical protein
MPLLFLFLLPHVYQPRSPVLLLN